jgi:SMC interacting uncharacterized protein involved in chromosome segregation
MDITLPLWATILVSLGGLAGIAALIQANLAVRKQAFEELKGVIEALKSRVDDLEEENRNLRQENVELRETVRRQALEIGELERRLDDREL